MQLTVQDGRSPHLRHPDAFSLIVHTDRGFQPCWVDSASPSVRCRAKERSEAISSIYLLLVEVPLLLVASCY